MENFCCSASSRNSNTTNLNFRFSLLLHWLLFVPSAFLICINCPRRLRSHLLRMEEWITTCRTYMHTYVVHTWSCTPLSHGLCYDWVLHHSVVVDSHVWGWLSCYLRLYHFSVISFRYLPVWACHPSVTLWPIPFSHFLLALQPHYFLMVGKGGILCLTLWCGVCWTLQCRVS